MSQLIRVADLFSGAGGLSEGFRQAGCRILMGSDIDADACASYALNFPEARTIHGDIRQEKVRFEIIRTARNVDIVVGGPPCQAFSQMRNHCRLIDDPKNSLYREFVLILNMLEPRAFVMENVPGLEQMGVREQIVEDLSLKGMYKVQSQVVDAADFGVPQTRKRILFLGIHSSLHIAPPILCGSGATEVISLKRMNGGHRVRYRVLNKSQSITPTAVTAEQAIGDLAFLRAGDRCDAIAVTDLPSPTSTYQQQMRQGLRNCITNVSVPRINTDTRIRLLKLPPGGNYRDLPRELTLRYLSGELWGPSNGTGHLGRRHYYAYRKLHPHLWSWTLNTKADSVYHYSRPRALSVREFARLQSFPDRFQFTTDPRRGILPGRIEGGAAHSRYRQVGNAVPPLLACAIAKQLLSLLRSHGGIKKSA